VRESLNGIQRRSSRNTKAVVVGSCSLQESLELPTLRSRQTRRRIGAFNNILVKINQTEISIRQLQFLVSPLDTNDVRTRSVEGLDEACWQDGNEDTCPLERV
jgi:hypothetical protein